MKAPLNSTPLYVTTRFLPIVPRSGVGEYRWPDGRVYIGAWYKARQHGAGEFWAPNGTHFKGQYKDGLINGEGTLEWSDGRKYEGQWKNNLQDGVGKYWAMPGEYREGRER